MAPEDPHDSDLWLEQIGLDHDPILARALRVISNRGDHAVGMIVGEAALPYLPWVRDGLSMSSKLIVLLEPRERDFSAALEQQMALDIRIAAHTQDPRAFAADVSDHRVDLLVGALGQLPLEMMKESGQAVLIGSLSIPDGYFGAPVGESSVMITLPGRQHRLSRRNRTGS